jgi:HEAT repeat protein
MDYSDITNCLKILNDRPNWFFQKENINEKLQCFDTIQQVGSPSTIYSLISFLRSNNTLIQTKAAETVIYLFSKLKSLNDYADSLKHLDIDKRDLESYRIDFDERTYVQILGIASLNGNGYVREMAVKELERLKNADGLKFILLRLGDWVEAVRKAATEAVFSFLKDAYINYWLKQLSIIDWLLKVERVDLGEVHSRIIQFVINQDFSEEFFKKIKQLDDKARFQFYKNFLSKKSPTRQEIYRIVADKNFLVRAELLKRLTLFEPTVQRELLEKFLQDQSATVRLNTLYASKPFSPEFDDQIAVLLSDESASVRELSRHLLKGKGIDFAQLYRQRIADKKFLTGSLLGLSETGYQEDLPIFEQNIFAKRSELVVASLIAVNKFNSDTAKHYALELLVHKSSRVRNKAVEILAKNIDGLSLEKVRGIYAVADYEIKRSVLKLFNKIGGWSIIGDLLLALNDENINIQNLAWQLVEKWKLNAIRLFTTPSRAEMERANQIYGTLDPNKLKMTDSRTSFLQDLKFYLS